MSLFSERQLIAQKGKFRVVSVDTWAGPFEDDLEGDFDTLAEAIEEAKDVEDAESWIKAYAYDDEGKCVYQSEE